MTDPFATLAIDTESEPGSWAEVLSSLVNCRVSNFNHTKPSGTAEEE